ncbi:hypothetical protein [Streptomyces atratus]|uniref:hypothetical protein n=1 Tax=Streptomyces atratus TaxID=1893 RepID=UPI0033C94262
MRSAVDERSVLVEPTGKGALLRTRAECVPDLLLTGAGLGADEVEGLRAELHALAARAVALAERTR